MSLRPATSVSGQSLAGVMSQFFLQSEPLGRRARWRIGVKCENSHDWFVVVVLQLPRCQPFSEVWNA